MMHSGKVSFVFATFSVGCVTARMVLHASQQPKTGYTMTQEMFGSLHRKEREFHNKEMAFHPGDVVTVAASKNRPKPLKGWVKWVVSEKNPFDGRNGPLEKKLVG